MSPSELDRFHEACREHSFRKPLAALLEEFRQGRIADRRREQEDETIRSVFAEHAVAWDQLFPAFPDLPRKRRSMRREHHRGRRDAYLRGLIVAALRADESGRRVVFNPVTVAGRHARMLARKLPDYEVIGTDVDPRWGRNYYFPDRYGRARYPRSRTARELIDTETLIDVARNTRDSDICRRVIDLDRCEYLRENGYDVIYREELFFAHRREGDGH